jgi:hypothetical protein
MKVKRKEQSFADVQKAIIPSKLIVVTLTLVNKCHFEAFLPGSSKKNFVLNLYYPILPMNFHRIRFNG